MSWNPDRWAAGPLGGGIVLPGQDFTRQRLLEDVESWLIRDDIAVSESIDTILGIAEDYLATDLRLVAQERSTTLVINTRKVTAPVDFMQVRAIFIDGQRLEYKTPETLREASEWKGGRTPMSFTIEGSDTGLVEFVFAPAGVPASPTTAELLYFARLRPLIEDDDTNWLLRNHYTVYLYATLRAAAEWVRELDLEKKYQAQYEACIARLNKSENRRRFGALAKQSYGSPRTVV